MSSASNADLGRPDKADQLVCFSFDPQSTIIRELGRLNADWLSLECGSHCPSEENAITLRDVELDEISIAVFN